MFFKLSVNGVFDIHYYVLGQCPAAFCGMLTVFQGQCPVACSVPCWCFGGNLWGDWQCFRVQWSCGLQRILFVVFLASCGAVDRILANNLLFIVRLLAIYNG